MEAWDKVWITEGEYYYAGLIKETSNGTSDVYKYALALWRLITVNNDHLRIRKQSVSYDIYSNRKELYDNSKTEGS